MVKKIFYHPYWFHRAFNYTPLLLVVILLCIEFSLFTILLLIIPFIYLSCIYFYHGKLCRYIEVNNDGLKGFRYNKSVVEIKWEEITKLVIEKKYLTSFFPFINLVSNDKNKRIIFIEKIKDYKELMTIINKMAVNLTQE